MARSELGRSVEVEKGRRRFPNQPTLDRNDCFHTDMYSDGTRTGHYGLINCKTGDYCCCHYCDLLYGATLYQGRPGTHGATLDTDHPQPDLRDDYNLPPFPVDPNDRDPVLEKCGRGERGDRGEEGSGSEGGDGAATVVGRGGGGQRAPQRRPVFSLSGLYYQPQPDQFSLSHPWEFSPEEGSCPVEPGLGLRHCSPVREHCSCVAQRGGIAAGTWTHPFASGGQALSPPLNPGYSQFIGQQTKHRQMSCSLEEQTKRRHASCSLEEQTKHRHASYSCSLEEQTKHRHASYSCSLEEQTKHRQGHYSPEEQSLAQLKHRQVNYGSEKLIWNEPEYRLERHASYNPQEQRRKAGLVSEEQFWGQSKHWLRQNSLSSKNQDRQYSCNSRSPEDRPIQPQMYYSPGEQIWKQSRHRQTSNSSEDQVFSGGEYYNLDTQRVGEHHHLDRRGLQGDGNPHMPNGYGGGPSPRPEGGGATRHEWRTRLQTGRAEGGAGEDVSNGRRVRAGSWTVHKAFFPTEVPQRQLIDQRRHSSTCGSGSGHGAPGRGAVGQSHRGHDLVDGVPGSGSSGAVDGVNEDMRERSKKSASQEVNQSPREDPNLEPQKQTGKQKECQVSVRENRCSVREKDGSVRDQIRQVVSDLEQVLGGLKQVHVEMKEVVHQIDHLTSNIDLGEVEGTSTASPPGGMSVLNPRDGRGVLVYNQNTSPGDLVLHLKAPEGHTPGPHGRAQNHTVARHSPPDPRGVPGVLKNSQKHDGGQGTQSTDPDQTVTIETTSPSLVLTASVIKTNRVIAATPRDPKPDRYGPNGHGPLSGPNREMNHGMHHLMMPSTQLSLLPLTPDLTSDLTSDPAPDLTDLSSRREKPPAYLHHNGQMERISKGLAPPTYPAHPALPVLPHLAQPPYPTHPNHPTPKTPPHLGKGRTGSSMV